MTRDQATRLADFMMLRVVPVALGSAFAGGVAAGLGFTGAADVLLSVFLAGVLFAGLGVPALFVVEGDR